MATLPLWPLNPLNPSPHILFLSNAMGGCPTSPIGKNVLMANDVPEFMGRVNENENRSKISVSAESKVEADKIFNELSAGGNIEMPIADSPWGSYFGMFRDKYGIEWTVDFDPKYKGQAGNEKPTNV